MPNSANHTPPVEVVDLNNCDREPIQIPGAIQPHGCLLVCDAGVTVVRRASANAARMLGLAPGEIIGSKFDSLFGELATHDIRNALARSDDPARAGLIQNLRLRDDGPVVDVAVHVYRGAAIVEFEIATDEGGTPPLELARTLIGRIRKLETPENLIAGTARLMRALIGYDRVMVYRFAHDGSGEVISEAKRSDLDSFLGQHFPASDIPQQARQLYLDNIIRLIGDASATPCPVEPVLLSGEPLDMSFAHLRAVSPIHCEYLRNMGVAASMSVSIIVDGGLWGLIACHHYAPRTLRMPYRVAAEMFGQFFAMNLQALQRKRSLELAVRARHTIDSMMQRMSHHLDIGTFLTENLEGLGALMPCDGIGLWFDGKWTPRGATPPAEILPALGRYIGSLAQGRSWASHALSDGFPPALDFREVASGVLAIPLSQTPRDYLMFFRKEVIQTVEWAGNPDKQYPTGPQGDRLTPRKSFAIWKETVEGQSKPWTDSDRDLAESSRAVLVEIVMRHNEVLADERAKSDLRQTMLNEELNHRVKNILALIKSLISHPVASHRTLQDYIESLRGRIQALAFAHDQVVRGSGGGPLIDLLNAELSPYREQAETVTLAGPQIQLDARAFSVLALVLHELATNAAKYGALSVRRGNLHVVWQLIDDAACEIVWRESAGPTVHPPAREGFGSVLLSRSIPFDLGGSSEVDYAPEGVVARLVIPGRYISSVAASRSAAAGAIPALAAERQTPLPGGLKVLLVEDQLIIALDAETILSDLGVGSVETAPSVAEALAALSRFAPDLAILDINLGSNTSWPIADELKRRGVPIVLASGYGDLGNIPGHWASLPTLRKPYDREMLLGAIRKALDLKP